jgi:hypothetical protein
MLTSCGEDEPDNDTIDPGVLVCQRDESEGPESALALAFGETFEGFICPIEDEDWFAFELPASDSLLRVQLAMKATLSPVEVTYALWSVDASGNKDKAVANPLSTNIGTAHDDSHCLAPGRYLLVVQDDGDNAQDLRQGYTLSLSSSAEPDQNEPNDDAAAATTLQAGQSVTGAIACRGDQDFFALETGSSNLLRVTLTAPIAQFQPTVRVYAPDDTLLIEEKSLAGSVRETAIEANRTLATQGRYRIVVSDDDDKQADPSVSYQLTVELSTDTDPNEPNNSPATATALSSNAVACSDGWSQSIVKTGNFGSVGDIDWFSLPLTGCTNAIIEAEVELDGRSWELNGLVQASVGLVRPHLPSSCAQDTDCRTLSKACSSNLDCSGLFETCTSEGLCAGASVCLPGGVCGANQAQRQYHCDPSADECQTNRPALPNIARLSAPLLGDELVYLRVSDYQANAAAPQTSYTLRVRVRRDPDTHEPSNLYENEARGDIPAPPQPATSLPVHDCTAGDCCGSSNWVQGSLAYDDDIDWFSYGHPCAGTDCTLRIRYEVDAGPVDAVLIAHTPDGAWYELLNLDEAENQSALSGAVGGTAPGDSCFYAFQGHEEYFLSVRDRRSYFRDGVAVPASRDWSGEQRYRICLEKLANDCLEPPCKVYTSGCGVP